MTKFSSAVKGLQKKIKIINGQMIIVFDDHEEMNVELFLNYKNSFEKVPGHVVGDFEKHIIIPAKETFINATTDRFAGYVQEVL